VARYVNVAAVEFSTKTERMARDAPAVVLRETREILASLRGYDLDLVVFGEGVEAYGFPPTDLNAAESLETPGPFLSVYSEFARQECCHVAGSVKLREGTCVYNSIAFIDPQGETLGAYHKTFITDGEIEWGLASGQGAVVVETSIGRLGGAICFDLNFASLRQEYKVLRPDILCFASMYHGGLMQAMWAYDCRTFFVSALQFHGCGILDPFGRSVKVSDCYTRIPRARINLDRIMIHLDHNRDKFPAIEKKYLGEIELDIPPNIGSALLYSTTEKRTAMDVAREFELELLDEYMERSIQANARNRSDRA